jgi:serine/threonine-protein kinase
MGALAAAHARGVVHRDLKPANIFLARSAGALSPKLIDFGISKIVRAEGEDGTHTTTGALIGTPQYMSPEQVNGERDIDGQTDVWSLAVVLYEMLAGRAPFVAPSSPMLFVQIAMHEPPRLSELAPEVPAPVAELVHRALRKDRKQRFRSMRDFLDATLQLPAAAGDSPERSLAIRHKRSIPYLAGEGTGEVALHCSDRIPMELPVVTSPGIRRPAGPAWLGPRGRIVAASVGGVLVLALTAALVLRKPPPSEPPAAPVAVTKPEVSALPAPSTATTTPAAPPAPAPATSFAGSGLRVRLERAQDLARRGLCASARREASAILADHPGNPEAREVLRTCAPRPVPPRPPKPPKTGKDVLR